MDDEFNLHTYRRVVEARSSKRTATLVDICVGNT